ncbi:MAG: hypothetical protein JWO80_4846, partial [Bryobacterales bacterium]|nr:hypothetical protein [Bryobacterales bacterium]
SCPECADQVLAGAAFVDNARAVLPKLSRTAVPERSAPVKGRFSWFPWSFAPQAALACIVLLAVIAGYQNLVEIPHLRVRAASDGMVLSGAQVLTARRAASDISFSAKLPVVSVVIPNEWEESFPRYASEIRRESRAETVMSSPETAAAGSIVISIPATRLGPGKYTMILYGVSTAGSRQIVGRYPFTVQE